MRRHPSRVVGPVLILLLLVAGTLSAQQNLVVNGDFEAAFSPVSNPDPLDGLSPDEVPLGWSLRETFSGTGVEFSMVSRRPENGSSLPGRASAEFWRTGGGASGDWTAIYQTLAVDVRGCSHLDLDIDTLVDSHDLEAGGFVTPAFEWPVTVEIVYTTTSGASQIWRYGWYVDPPGDSNVGPVDDPGEGLIPIFMDREVTPGEWTSNSFNLLKWLPQVRTLDSITVGGSGWSFFGAADNVQLRCATRSMDLNQGRFRVGAEWRSPSGETGFGKAVQVTDDSGYFWFFNPDNAELVVKVLDVCAEPFNHFWVFSAGLTNVEVTLRVTDLASGQERVYLNPLGQAYAPVFDTSGFDTCDVPFVP